MVKKGPCCHCGVTSTPLWRNGPAHKPILCNACGSRWRTKGTLENYVPQHVRELTDQVELKVSKEKITPLKNNLQRVQKRKLENVIAETEQIVPLHEQNFQKVLEEDTGNRSSSGSATSCSEDHIHAGAPDIIDLRASAQFCGWNVPSRKRSCIHRARSSPLARLQKDLYSIFSAQGSSSTPMASDGDLLYQNETETQSGSIEIGHGVVLIRPPSAKAIEEESEASSFPADNQSYIANEAISQSASHSVSTGCIRIGKSKEHIAELAQEHEKRDKTLYEMLNIKHDRKSPLISIDLNIKENTLGDRSIALKHSRSTPFKRQNNPVLKGSMRTPVGKCRPSGLSICSKTLTNSSDAASRLTHTGDTLTGNKDGESMLSSFQLTVQDIHLSVPANISTSNSEAKNLGNPYKGKTVKKASFEGHGSNSSQPKHRGPNNITANAALFECSNVCL
ncbi:GATA transcription factor 26-like isoform X2 [Dioscorea cayenensis subsp. rotundata]|uniref:GATA transcription factor 26-like isoform X2 n=1 Tax=Dioscorea cayennensis subsp. rotundata TaxID=55577 RepID=A0AB40CPM1_DIOCR|nr:GATA transcription factor 26-like isoform X2 [Dioscorea cayenensis subsp. rotundata]